MTEIKEVHYPLEPIQIQQLLKPIHPSRVLELSGHSHVSQQDIVAHLIRIFGFGNFDIEVLKAELVFEAESVDTKTGAIKPGRYDVTYRALVRLTVKNTSGQPIASYENGSMGVAQNQSRGDAHDLAYKSAISLSVKRAAINLGDQFGLSLYNKGQRDALVMASLAYPLLTSKTDIQEGVAQQHSLGNDEVDKGSDEGVTIGKGESKVAKEPAKEPETTVFPDDVLFAAANAFDTIETMKTLFELQRWYNTETVKKLWDVPVDLAGSTIRSATKERIAQITKENTNA